MASLQFWKPGTAGPGSNLDRATENEALIVPSAPSTSRALPIHPAKQKLLYAIQNYGVVILVGQTGSGKTTR